MVKKDMRLRKKNLIENEKEIVSLNPKSLVSHFYNKVDITTAAIVIFISIFIETLLLLFLKSPNVLSFFTIRIIVTFIFSWIILGAILYLILYFVKGKNNLKGGEYKQILSGLASFRVVSILSVLVVLVIVLIFMPKLIPFMSVAMQNPAGFLESGVMPSLGSGAGVGIFLLIIFAIALIIYYISMLYNFVKNMYDFEITGNLLMTLVILVIMVLFSTIL